MSFAARSTEDLVKIALAGAGLRMTAPARSTADLVRIASAAKQGGVSLVIAGMVARSTEDLVQIAAAGRGCVTFEG